MSACMHKNMTKLVNEEKKYVFCVFIFMSRKIVKNVHRKIQTLHSAVDSTCFCDLLLQAVSAMPCERSQHVNRLDKYLQLKLM